MQTLVLVIMAAQMHKSKVFVLDLLISNLRVNVELTPQSHFFYEDEHLVPVFAHAMTDIHGVPSLYCYDEGHDTSFAISVDPHTNQCRLQNFKQGSRSMDNIIIEMLRPVFLLKESKTQASLFTFLNDGANAVHVSDQASELISKILKLIFPENAN